MKDVLRKQSTQLWLLLAACMVFVFIIKPWQLYFRNDDFIHIPMPHKWLFLRGGFMRPVSNFFMMADRLVYGTNATGYFFTTLFFHSSTVFVIYFLVKKIAVIYTQAVYPSFIASLTALLFLYYPWHAEPLMWAIGQGSVIATFFALLSILFFIKSAEKTNWFFLSWVCFVAALFTYESIWNLPLVFITISMLEYKKQRLKARQALVYAAMMLVTFIAYLFTRVFFLETIAGDGYLEMNENIKKPLLVISNLLKLVVRNYTPPFTNTTVFLCAALLVTSLLAFLVFTAFRKNRQIAPLFFLLITGVITGVLPAVPLGIDTHYNEGERYLYYSSFFYCFLLAIIITNLFASRKAVVAVALSVMVVFLLLLIPLQKNYAFASAISRTTMSSMAGSTPAHKLFFIDVPGKCDGALIFRTGLKNGIQWMHPGKFDSLVIVSQVPNVTRGKLYLHGATTWRQLAQTKHWDATQHIVYGDSASYPVSGNSLVYWYKNDGLYQVQF